MLQLHFKIAQINGSLNTAADFLSRLDLKFTGKIRFKTREELQTTHIDVTTSSSDVAAEEQIFFTPTDEEDEFEKQGVGSKNHSRKNATQWEANEEPSSMKPIIKEFTKVDGNSTSYSVKGIEANARIRVEKDVDEVLKNLKLKIFDQTHDDVPLTSDSRFKYYKVNKDRIIMKDGVLFRKNYEKNL